MIIDGSTGIKYTFKYTWLKEVVMPQISLYVDAQTLEKVEAEAKAAKVSISKYVASVLHEKFEYTWPQSFLSLFGSIKDESFVRPEDAVSDQDTERQKL